MRLITLIFLVFTIAIPVKSQQIRPAYLGNASWRKLPGQAEREAIAVSTKKLPVTKIKTPDIPANIFTRKIDPGTITLHLGPTLPVLQKIRITGVKLPPPVIMQALPLLTRDNNSFNVNYTDKKHGYAANFAMDFTEDKEHNIWIASEKGLIRYDGYHYYLYQKKINFLDMPDCSLDYDQQNRIWSASDNGVYFIKNDSLFTIQSPEIDLSTIACKEVLIDKYQRVWITTKQKGVLCIDGSTMKIYDTRCGLPGNYFESVYLDKKGRLFMACRDFGIVVIEPGKMRMFFSKSEKMKYHSFLSFYEDEDGIWAGSFLSGMMRMGSTDTLQYSITGKYNEAFYDITKAPGGIWLSCYSHAICYFTKTKLLQINETNGLLNKLPYKIFTDSYHNLWVSNLSGFSRINENLFYLEDYPNPALGYIRKIISNTKKGGKWMVTFGKNLVYQKGNEVTSYTYKTPTGIQPFLYVTDGELTKDGSIWMGTYGEGIVKVSGNVFTQYSYSKFTDFGIVRTVIKDAADNLWFSPTKFGLIAYDYKQFWHYTKTTGLLSNEVTNLFLDRDKKLEWTCVEGLQRLNDRAIETFYIGSTLLKDQVNGLLDLDPDTRLLATNNSGVLVIKKQQVYQLSTANGLLSNSIQTITRDSTGRIWISTEYGIESFTLTSLFIAEHHIYNQANGSYLLDAENVLLDAKGLPYWMVGDKKLVFNKNALFPEKKTPVFSFKKIEIDDQTVLPNEQISVLPNQKININYRTIYWGRENNLKLSYLLISSRNDTTERSVQNNGSIIINDILPGNYRILLKALDNNDVFYSGAISLTIHNYWYNTWLFRIITGILLISGIIFYFRQKGKRQLYINDVLQRKVREQTELIEKEKDALLLSYQTIDLQNKEKDVLIEEINHRVKNNLQFIAAILELQLGNQISNEVILALLETSRRIKAMSLIHELLYTNQEQKGLSMQTYVQELVDNLAEMAIDDTNPVNIEMDIDNLVMDSKTALSIGMIISELVSNSFKHAFTNIRDPEIRIQLKKDTDPGTFRLMVSDNGNGFRPQPEFPNGLGSNLVDIFSRQLDGKYTKHTKGYFMYELQFKLSKK